MHLLPRLPQRAVPVPWAGAGGPWIRAHRHRRPLGKAPGWTQLPRHRGRRLLRADPPRHRRAQLPARRAPGGRRGSDRDGPILVRHPPASQAGGRPAVLPRALHHGDLRPGRRILRLEDRPPRRTGGISLVPGGGGRRRSAAPGARGGARRRPPGGRRTAARTGQHGRRCARPIRAAAPGRPCRGVRAGTGNPVPRDGASARGWEWRVRRASRRDLGGQHGPDLRFQRAGQRIRRCRGLVARGRNGGPGARRPNRGRRHHRSARVRVTLRGAPVLPSAGAPVWSRSSRTACVTSG